MTVPFLLQLVLACSNPPKNADPIDTTVVTDDTDTGADSGAGNESGTDTSVVDADGDGYAGLDDCDESDANVHAGADETCDGTDQDCDGVVDEDATDAAVWYADTDGDGFGDPASTTTACDPGVGWSMAAGDCDDADGRFHPGADEVDCADPNDYNCDGSTGYADADGDGWSACSECDDGSADVRPDATELCNAIDDDCDGVIDEGGADGETVWYADTDGDGYGDPGASVLACESSVPEGYLTNADDCDDTDAAVNPAAVESCNERDDDCDGTIDEADSSDARIWYEDADGDGWGVSSDTSISCEPAAGYAAYDGDCDDGDARFHPGALEADCADPNDYNCDGSTGYADADADGWAACTECDDGSAAVNPDAVEACNVIDDDCDGVVDETGALGELTWYADVDGDGYGDPSAPLLACESTVPYGYVSDATDCDDGRADVNPAAIELCNGVDDDCDGTVDEDSAADAAVWYADTDADTYGDASVTTRACTQPAGHVADATDCDDARALTNPDATEYCNSHDDDCDGTTDEDSSVDAPTWYADADADAYGDVHHSTAACSQPSGYVADDTDCDDARALTNPAATEYCNGVDDDCDGTTDEAAAADASTWYADADADRYGDAGTSTRACAAPSGYVADARDCDDGRALSNPGATEYCNGYDDDCDGTTDEAAAADAATWYADSDSDGFGDAASATVSCTSPAGHVADATDCDDARALTNPAATEYCNSDDDDCDGIVDDGPMDGTTYYADADGDGFGDESHTVSECSLPAGYADNTLDCDDADAAEPRVADAARGSATGTGLLGDPTDSIQSAIDLAYACVLVYPGTYTETIDLNGKSLDVFGVEGPDVTILDASTSGCNASSPSGCETAVTIASGSGARPTLRGLTITGGSGKTTSSTTSTTCADSSASHSGASACSVTTYDVCGGGVYVSGDDPTFEDVIIRENTLPVFARVSTGSYTQNWMYSYGGGVCVHDGIVTFGGSIIADNYADQGGGIYADRGTTVSFTQGLVSDNGATDGGGLNLNDATAAFTNAIVACNDAATDGGGIFSETSGGATFLQTVLFGNSSSTTGSARGLNAFVGAGTNFVLTSSISESALAASSLWGAGSGTFDYNTVYNSVGGTYGGTLAAGTGAYFVGNNFISARCDGNAYNDDYALVRSSVAIDHGDPTSNDVDETRADMGAYGGPNGAW